MFHIHKGSILSMVIRSIFYAVITGASDGIGKEYAIQARAICFTVDIICIENLCN